MSLDPTLARDTRPLFDTEHAQVLLANDARWPWLILVPRDTLVTEVHQLAPDARAAFLETASAVGEALQDATGCRSVNIAMLGNMVSQLHCHVVARSPGDPNWPAPVWGFGEAVPREQSAELPAFAREVRELLTARPG